MGGRLDAVNLLDADAAAVVSVGLDHREWLGDTRGGHRLREGRHLPRRPAGDIRRAARPEERRSPSAAAIGAQGSSVSARTSTIVERADGWDYVGFGSRRRELPLPAPRAARSQLGNAAVALAVLEAVEPRLLVPDEAVQRWPRRRVRLPGRFQVFPGHAGMDPGRRTQSRMRRSRWPRASRRVLAAAARSPSAGSSATRTSKAIVAALVAAGQPLDRSRARGPAGDCRLRTLAESHQPAPAPRPCRRRGMSPPGLAAGASRDRSPATGSSYSVRS